MNDYLSEQSFPISPPSSKHNYSYFSEVDQVRLEIRESSPEEKEMKRVLREAEQYLLHLSMQNFSQAE